MDFIWGLNEKFIVGQTQFITDKYHFQHATAASILKKGLNNQGKWNRSSSLLIGLVG